MRDLVSYDEREFVVVTGEANESRRYVKVISVGSVGEHEIADLEKRFLAAGVDRLHFQEQFTAITLHGEADGAVSNSCGAIED